MDDWFYMLLLLAVVIKVQTLSYKVHNLTEQLEKTEVKETEILEKEETFEGLSGQSLSSWNPEK